jgi:tetratricopeptide (TPR) repeat protein
MYLGMRVPVADGNLSDYRTMDTRLGAPRAVTQSYYAIVFSDLERHSVEWARVPREKMVGIIAEYRYLAESLAGQYGCLYREWTGDGHMFLFGSADAAAQFGLRLIADWRTAGAGLPALQEYAHMQLRIGCHFGECTRLEGEEAWVGRGNALAKRVEGEAEGDCVVVTENVLDLLDLPLYEFQPAGERRLKGDYLPARQLYRLISFDSRAIEARPREELSAEDWFLRGASLIGTEREWSDEEAECYREAIRLRPDYPEAHVNYAILLRRRGDESEAARHYQEALRLRPDYPEAHYNYAALLHARGSAGGAARHYREALSVRPDYVDAHHGYATLLASRAEFEAADEHYREALRLRPENVQAHMNYAVLLEQSGRFEESARHYREALRLDPDAPTSHYNYALLLEARGETTAAEQHYREALRLWPGYGEAHNNLAILLQLRGEDAKAEEHYLAALEARPHDPETHYNYGLLLRARGDAESAEQHLRTAFELAPDEPVFRSALEGPT